MEITYPYPYPKWCEIRARVGYLQVAMCRGWGMLSHCHGPQLKDDTFQCGAGSLEIAGQARAVLVVLQLEHQVPRNGMVLHELSGVELGHRHSTCLAE
jgi:hypothetical protein